MSDGTTTLLQRHPAWAGSEEIDNLVEQRVKLHHRSSRNAASNV